MEKMTNSEKISIYRGLTFIVGCLGMYFWVSSGIERCGSFFNDECIFSESFDELTCVILFFMILIGLMGLVRTVLVLIIITTVIAFSSRG